MGRYTSVEELALSLDIEDEIEIEVEVEVELVRESERARCQSSESSFYNFLDFWIFAKSHFFVCCLSLVRMSR